MATGVRNDPYRGFNFRVEIDGVTLASFSEVTGLTADGDAVPYREGADKVNSVRQLVGLRKNDKITLKRGFTQNMEFWNWYAAIAAGQRATRRYAKRQTTWFRHQTAPDLTLTEQFSQGLLRSPLQFVRESVLTG